MSLPLHKALALPNALSVFLEWLKSITRTSHKGISIDFFLSDFIIHSKIVLWSFNKHLKNVTCSDENVLKLDSVDVSTTL